MKMFQSYHLLSGLLVAAAFFLLTDAAAVPETSSEWKIVSKVLDDCISKEETFNCLGVKAAAFMQRAQRSANIELVPGVVIKKDSNDDSRAGRALSEAELENSLPVEASERSGRVFDMLMDGAVNFLQSHSLEVKLPASDIARSLETGRLKLKKTLLPLLLGGGLKFLILPLAIVAIAIMAFKALAIGKLALLIAASVGLPKILSGGLGGIFAPKTKTIEVVSHPVHSGFSSTGAAGNTYSSGFSASNGWSRNIDAQQEEAQKLVYRGQAPAATQQ
ncbi:uncharacterized protein LOC132192428 [Neocloeon triangulifer]|uniref:uncharacterized protein LOC132192428 n=1 Tax=Neocloeon triangulifer TaxID=2078957 RepID=UPI00286EEC2E|nr:uncharacterized protein LOC132192428 [Neocloeon triangulifer]